MTMSSSGYLYSIAVEAADGGDVTDGDTGTPIPTSWNFAELTEAIQSKTGEWNGLIVDATNGKLGPHNTDCCAQFNQGTILKVPVAGPCLVTVAAHNNEGKYANYTINGEAASLTASSTVVAYGGEAGYVEIEATGSAYIKSIEISEIPTSWNFAELTEAIQSKVAEWNGLMVDATNGKLGPHSTDCCAQFNQGTILKVPVAGPCLVTVAAHNNEGKYANYTINGEAASLTASSTAVAYGGEAGYVEIEATGSAYIKTIEISEIPTSWNFAELTEAIQSKVAVWNGLTVDATNGKLGPHSTDCCAQFNEGTVLKVPVAGPSTISVTAHNNEAKYALYTINGKAASTTETPATEIYTGKAGYVEIVATSGAYIKSISVEPYEIVGTSVKASISYAGNVIAGISGAYSPEANTVVFDVESVTLAGVLDAAKLTIAADTEDVLGGTYSVAFDTTNKVINVYNSTVDSGATVLASLPYKQAIVVSGTVDAAVNGEKLIFTAADGSAVTAVVADGAYSVELELGASYTVTFENGLYSVTSGASVDLSNTAADATVTNDITYVKSENRIELDANAITWDFRNKTFGSYGSTGTWYSGDGLTITGTMSFKDTQHGATINNGQVFSVNVPAGQTTITLGVCAYGSSTATIGEQAVDLNYGGDGSKDGVEKTFIFTNDADATINITLTAGGFLHYISAKTETVKPSATVTGSVDAAVNGEVLNFMVGTAPLASATIADGKYTVDLPVGSKYTVAFANADIYEVTSGATVDLTSVTAGSTVTNNITYAAWDVSKSFSVKVGDTTFNVTPGSSKADAFTTAVGSGSGEVELSTPKMALVWANLQGLGSGVLTADKITAASDNITTSFSGNVLTVTYNDKTTNPASYQITVKDNSGTGTPLADGTPINYSFTDGSIVSTLYDGKAYSLSSGQTLSSTDKLLTLTANKKIFYNGVQHGIAIGQNDSISIKVAGDAEITFGTCLYTNGQNASELTVSGLAEGGTVTPATGNFTSVEKDGELITFKYKGGATTLIFTYASAGSGYIHSVSVKNNAIASNVANAQTMMPKVLSYGTAASLEALPVGQRMILTQTGGQMTTVDEAVNPSVSYFGFEPVTGKYKLEADVVLSTGASSNYSGIFFGAFDANNVGTVGIRSLTGLRGILSKNPADMVGASTINETITSGQKVHFTAEKTADCFVITATPEGDKTYTMELDYKDADCLLFQKDGIDTAISYGMVVANASAVITNMKFYNEEGTVVYNQNDCYDPVGTAPEVVSVTAAADESREFITVSWTSNVAASGDGRYVVQVSKDGGAWTDVEVTTASTCDYAISKGGSYTFRVAGRLGEDGEPNKWVESPALNVIAALTKPVVTANATANSIELSWQEVEEAIKYEVYRYSFDEGEAASKLVATVSSASYTDYVVEEEMPYYYNVVAYSAANHSNPSVTVWAMATEGHTGEYVYEDEATEIFITKKSYDTVFTNKVTLEGNVYGEGTLEAVVNGTVVETMEMAVGDAFSFELTVEEGRNDVNLLFTDEGDKVTRKTFNFVYLTNYDIVVDASYTGADGEAVNGIPTYKTVQAAVNSVPSNNTDNKVILVMAGDYVERLDVNTPYISLIGEDRENTFIHCYPADILGPEYAVGGSMDKRCAIYIRSGATGFSAENIYFANDCDYGKTPGQADAVRVDADKATFVNCQFYGVQDTLYMDKGYQYYYKCRIEGLIDFIYTGEQARILIEDCEVVFVYEPTKKSGYTSAPKTAENAPYGIIFNNCSITAEEGCGGDSYLLARPWGENAYITWINCYMGKVLNANAPYSDMSGNSYKAARFFEYGSYGPSFAVNADRRQISTKKANEMLSNAYLGWEPATWIEDISADHYVGDITTNRDEQFGTAVRDDSKYLQTDGDDTGLKMYDAEGYAEAYGVTGGGLLKETNSNYYAVATAEEFLSALLAIQESGMNSVIELTADINLGCNEVENFASYSDVIKAHKNQALTHPTLIESGVSQLNLAEFYNLTIFSQNGASIKHAGVSIKESENIMIRNIKFDELWEWDEATNGNYDRNDWDFVTIDSGSTGIWLDHCTFYKAYDGIVDIKNPNPISNITISWCEFLPGSEGDEFFNVMMDEITANTDKYASYQYMLDGGMTKEQIYAYAHAQKKTHLLGQDDSYTNAVGIRLTMANNYYKNSMDRLPRLRYGTAHVYNCIMDAQELLDLRLSISNSTLAQKVVSNGAISTCDAQILLENCYINGIQNALNSGNSNSPSGYINAINSVYYMDGVLTKLEPIAKSHVDDRVLITDADEFVADLPYGDYYLYDAETLYQTVVPGAGAGKLDLTVLQWEKASYNDTYVAPVVPENDNKFAADISDGISEDVLTDEIKKVTNANTVEELMAYLTQSVANSEVAQKYMPNMKLENTQVMDVVIKVSKNGGLSWVVATPDNFPANGLEIILPYPKGTNAEDYKFVIGHMVTMACNGMTPGQMEYFNPEETADGLKICIKSASPFVIGWEKVDTDEEPDDDVVDDGDEEDDDDNKSILDAILSPKTFFDEDSFIHSILWPDTDSEKAAQNEQSTNADASANADSNAAEDAQVAAGAVVQNAEEGSNNNLLIMLVVAALAVIAASGVVLFRRKNEEM